MDFAEWIVQIRGFLPRGDKFLRVDLNISGNIPGDMNQTHLQCACQHRVLWAIDFILAVSEGIDRNFFVFGNSCTALHYIVKMGDPLHFISFMDHGHFIQLHANKQGKFPLDVAETREMKDFLISYGMKQCGVEEYISQN
jgi:hypothetical protein